MLYKEKMLYPCSEKDILHLLKQAGSAKPLGEKIRRRIHIMEWDELTSSLNALECLAGQDTLLCADGEEHGSTRNKSKSC